MTSRDDITVTDEKYRINYDNYIVFQTLYKGGLVVVNCDPHVRCRGNLIWDGLHMASYI